MRVYAVLGAAQGLAAFTGSLRLSGRFPVLVCCVWWVMRVAVAVV